MTNTNIIFKLGEKLLVSKIIDILNVDSKLIGGFGHDSAFLDININDDEVLLLNTDRSGLNLTYTLNISDAKCVGDFAISHSISDILISGGSPIAVSIALLLPKNTNFEFVRDTMLGAQEAAKKYGAFIASSDTKNNHKFAIVVTAIGKCKKDQIISRKGAKVGDLIVATGYFGTMISGYLAIKNNLKMSAKTKKLFYQALTHQNPPYKIANKISQAKIVNSGIDNSDGLSSSIYTLCENNNLGAIIYKDSLPIRDESKMVAKKLNIDEFLLCLASGDWQFIYSIPKENVQHFMKINQSNNTKATIIGEFIENSNVLLKSDNSYHILQKIQNDRFSQNSIFDQISKNINYLG
ncbi:thiamine-phosphate kinase [Campylobacter gastrosuis]|uniref:Thiamine-monophosphate kinase n=1 Tax=Campylobacter gastrosuis TaxID=2974576 RepID=A0ABT7HP27_9BACT|nr:thiamine-phosphate kinase [Campylobacter gastrosuis]MDL0088687.1 thiamine-phosphate kinase [Campylobacter gastrosuis]